MGSGNAVRSIRDPGQEEGPEAHCLDLAPQGHLVPAPALLCGATVIRAQRGPVIATLTEPRQRNAIGTHAGTYARLPCPWR